MNWHHIFDGGGGLAARYGVRAIPAVYLVGKDGKVVSDKARGRRLETAVKEALLRLPKQRGG
jgi:thioredoxin-like negative regulator of GroEL